MIRSQLDPLPLVYSTIKNGKIQTMQALSRTLWRTTMIKKGKNTSEKETFRFRHKKLFIFQNYYFSFFLK